MLPEEKMRERSVVSLLENKRKRSGRSARPSVKRAESIPDRAGVFHRWMIYNKDAEDVEDDKQKDPEELTRS